MYINMYGCKEFDGDVYLNTDDTDTMMECYQTFTDVRILNTVLVFTNLCIFHSD